MKTVVVRVDSWLDATLGKVRKIGQSTDIQTVGKAALKIRGVLLMPLVQMASTPDGYWDGFEERLLADGILFAWKKDGAAEFVAT